MCCALLRLVSGSGRRECPTRRPARDVLIATVVSRQLGTRRRGRRPTSAPRGCRSVRLGKSTRLRRPAFASESDRHHAPEACQQHSSPNCPAAAYATSLTRLLSLGPGSGWHGRRVLSRGSAAPEPAARPWHRRGAFAVAIAVPGLSALGLASATNPRWPSITAGAVAVNKSLLQATALCPTLAPAIGAAHTQRLICHPSLCPDADPLRLLLALFSQAVVKQIRKKTRTVRGSVSHGKGRTESTVSTLAAVAMRADSTTTGS